MLERIDTVLYQFHDDFDLKLTSHKKRRKDSVGAKLKSTAWGEAHLLFPHLSGRVYCSSRVAARNRRAPVASNVVTGDKARGAPFT